MRELRFARRWRAASAALLLLVLIAAIAPAIAFWPPSLQVARWFAPADKLLHALTFAFLAVWFAGQHFRRDWWRIAMGLAAFGALIEIIQRSVGYRSAEWADLAADIVGIAAGLAVAAAGAEGWCRWVENRMPVGRNG